ncbi:ABC transporter ATP-binding protein [Leifsonia sp. Root112D2]|uniref:ABC transporter ATP-binding protein n=1 Tax=Leifsonia sp. Root112D2 TaxID=1736426 RepID=UPI0006F52973|nr:ABC transporter ATP-binding protein [Leifsonia sp. Root112D2]KQV07549.1 glutathione ABC transporter ATP-binding protein [Leifsonia sp. Root112D2]
MSDREQTAPTPQADGGAVLEVSGLNVDFWVEGEWYPAAIDVGYTLEPGRVLAIVGESGSGKSTSSMAMLGLLPDNARVSGSVRLKGKEILGLPPAKLRDVRGNEIAMIFQEPMTALNPVYTIGFQLVEAVRIHLDVGPHEARERAMELLALVGIPDPETSFTKYPHQLSGGQRQRVMIAQALSCDPALLIADEPTTALDVTVQAEILELLRDLHTRLNSGIVLITHDMGVVADLADDIVVMKNGRILERGTVRDVFHNAQHPYTKELLAAVPHLGVTSSEVEPGTVAEHREEPTLALHDVVVEYPSRRGVPAFRAVDTVSLEIYPSEIVGLVGESGSGKTTLGRAATGLLPITSGSLSINGHDMVSIRHKELRELRRKIGFVFQDPGSSLNPRLPIGQSIGEPILLTEKLKGQGLQDRVSQLLDSVELSRTFRNRYPHELSGGQRQRVGIARALALGPDLLVADEPTSALDVSVQARFLELLHELQEKLKFACLFISHDLAVVDQMAHRIAVMYKGVLVEQGTSDEILRAPKDPYTQRLIAAIPVPDPDSQAERRQLRTEQLRLDGLA